MQRMADETRAPSKFAMLLRYWLWQLFRAFVVIFAIIGAVAVAVLGGELGDRGTLDA
jgi:hypothetical protein